MTVRDVVERIRTRVDGRVRTLVGERYARFRGRNGDAERGRECPDAGYGALFRCPECETVYLAREKTTCSACDDEVEQVRSTLS